MADRQWTAEGDWSFRVEAPDGSSIIVAVVGARMEPDYDEDGYRGYFPEYDAFTVDGREPTDYEKDDLSDKLCEEIRGQYRNT